MQQACAFLGSLEKPKVSWIPGQGLHCSSLLALSVLSLD